MAGSFAGPPPVPSTLPGSPVETPARPGFKLLLKRQIEKVKVTRRLRSPRHSKKDEDLSEDDEGNRPTKYERLERVVKRQVARGKAARLKLQEMRFNNKKTRHPLRRSFTEDNGGYNQQISPPLVKKKSSDRLQEEVLPDNGAVVYPRDAIAETLEDDFDDLLEDDDEDSIVSDDYFDDLDMDEDDEILLRKKIGQRVEMKLTRALLDVKLSSFALSSTFATFSLAIINSFLPNDRLLRGLLLLSAFLSVIMNLESVRKRALSLGAQSASASRFAKKSSSVTRQRPVEQISYKHQRRSDRRRSASVPPAPATVTHSNTTSPRTPPQKPVPKTTPRRSSASTTPLSRGVPLPLISKVVPHWKVPKVEECSEEGNTWSKVPASKFSLRGPTYILDRAKIPSCPALYEPIEMHVYDSNGMSQIFESFPSFLNAAKSSSSQGDSSKVFFSQSTSPFPQVLGLTLNVPKDAPSMRGFWPGSPCYTIVCVFRLSEDAKKIVNKPQSEWPTAYKLVQLWLDSADKDPAMNGRLKGIFYCRPASDDGRISENEAPLHTSPRSSPTTVPRSSTPRQKRSSDDSAVNYLPGRVLRSNSVDADRTEDETDDEAVSKSKGLPRILQKWNGKPVLMAENASGFSRHRKGISKLTRGPDYVEVCINVGESFSYMGRGAVYVSFFLSLNFMFLILRSCSASSQT